MKRIKKYSSTDTSKTRKHIIASIKKMSRKWGMFIKWYPLQVTRMTNTERIKAFAKLHLTHLKQIIKIHLMLKKAVLTQLI